MGVALTTPAGVLVDANPAFCRMLGTAAEAVRQGGIGGGGAGSGGAGRGGAAAHQETPGS